MTTARAPLVLFAELTDLDPVPAQELLAEHGITAEVMELDAQGTVVERQRGAIGIIGGYSIVDRRLIDQFPDLGIIAASSNGTNMIDVDYAVSRGVWVTNVGSAATEEVAVHTLTLALALVREIPEMTRTVSSGGWTNELPVTPRRLSNLTLGLVGYGRIGALVAKFAKPMFAKVIAYDPFRPPSDGYAESASFAEVLESSDVVSLHLPLSPETDGLLAGPELAQMKDGAILLNVSRGELVDLNDCRAALDSGKLAGLGFDVLIGEPPEPTHPLRTHPRALVTPHAAFLSDAALRQYETDPARYIADWFVSGKPSDCVVGTPAG